MTRTTKMKMEMKMSKRTMMKMDMKTNMKRKIMEKGRAQNEPDEREGHIRRGIKSRTKTVRTRRQARRGTVQNTRMK